jgi:hypothetical protein
LIKNAFYFAELNKKSATKTVAAQVLFQNTRTGGSAPSQLRDTSRAGLNSGEEEG